MSTCIPSQKAKSTISSAQQVTGNTLDFIINIILKIWINWVSTSVAPSLKSIFAFYTVCSRSGVTQHHTRVHSCIHLITAHSITYWYFGYKSFFNIKHSIFIAHIFVCRPCNKLGKFKRHCAHPWATPLFKIIIHCFITLHVFTFCYINF